MKLINDESGNKVFIEEGTINKIYTLLDMGSYIGHRSRAWYEESPEIWLLMFYDEEFQDKKNLFHAEALCDETGLYTRLIMEENGVKRVLQLNGNYLISDIIYDNRKNISDGIFSDGEEYIGYEHDIYNKNYMQLSDYISSNKTFKSKDNKSIDVYPSDTRIIDFLNNNEVLVNSLKEKTK